MTDAAARVFEYLSETDPLGARPFDAVMGFGMFDLSLASYCGTVAASGIARHIIFSGGIGAGTGDLGRPEADAWLDTLRRSHPSLVNRVLVENRSTNTAENVAFTAALLAAQSPPLVMGQSITRMVIVASPTRLRRVWLTLRQQHPSLTIARRLPPTTLAEDGRLYDRQGLNHRDHMLGELDRIELYADRGWIVPEPLPEAILEARQFLRQTRMD